MYPILFNLGPFKIYSYGLFMAMGFLTTIFLIEKKAKISNLCLLSFIFAILGARLMYVLVNISFYRERPLEILMLHHGGLMFHGGLIAGLAAAWVYLKKSKRPILSVMDIVALYLPLGQAIGRIGCFLNGCCFGREGHPAQLYASLGNIIIFMILRLVSSAIASPHRGEGKGEGVLFSLYLILYPINRIVVECFRADLPRIWMGLSLTQLISVGIFAAGIIIWKKNLISQP